MREKMNENFKEYENSINKEIGLLSMEIEAYKNKNQMWMKTTIGENEYKMRKHSVEFQLR